MLPMNRFRTLLARLGRALTEPPAARADREDYFRALIEHSNDVVFVMDADGAFRYASPSFPHLLGYTPEEMRGKRALDFVHPDDLPQTLHAIQERSQRGGLAAETMELRVRHKDGTYRLYEVRGNNLLAHPRIQGFVINAREITARKRAEAQLRASEERYRNLFNSVPIGLFRSTPDGRLLDANVALVEMFGYESRAALLAVNVRDLYADAADRARFIAQMETANAAENLVQAVRRDGTRIWTRSHSRAIRDEQGNILYYDGGVRDVTAQMRAEMTSRENETRFRKLFENSPIAVVLAVAGGGALVDVNASFLKMTGYERDQVIGKTTTELGLWVDLALGREILRVVLKHALVQDAESQIRRADGEIRDVIGSASLVEIGGAPHTIGTFIDRTEHKSGERALFERTRLTSLTAELGAVFNQPTDLSGLLQKCAEVMGAHLGAASLGIWTLDSATQILELQASAGVYNHLDGAHSRVPVGKFKIGMIAQTRAPHLTNAVMNDPLVSDPAWAVREGLIGFAGYPLIVEDRLVGVIAMFARHELAPFTLELLNAAAAGLAQAIGRKREELKILEMFQAEQRARRLAENLHAAHRALSESLDLDAVLQTTLDHLGALVPYDSAAVMLLERETECVSGATRGYADPEAARAVLFDTRTNTLLRKIIETRASVIVPDTQASSDWEWTAAAKNIQSWLGVPLIAGKQVVGIYYLDKHEPNFFTPAHAELAEALAPQAAVAIQNARLFEQLEEHRNRLRDLAHREISARELERQRVSHELHDDACQALIALKVGLEMIQTQLPKKRARLREQMVETVNLAATTLERVRKLAHELHPPALDIASLDIALQEYCLGFARRTRVVADFSAGTIPPLAEPIKVTLYRVLQEALSNVWKHAAATRVEIALECIPGAVALSVRDDGRGFERRQIENSNALGQKGIGLINMRERLELLGGHLEIESRPGTGTRVTARIPVESGG